MEWGIEIDCLWHRDKNYVLLRNGSTIQKYDCIKSEKNMAPFKSLFSFHVFFSFLKKYKL